MQERRESRGKPCSQQGPPRGRGAGDPTWLPWPRGARAAGRGGQGKASPTRCLPLARGAKHRGLCKSCRCWPGPVPGCSPGLGWHPLRLCSPGGYRQQDLFARTLQEWRRSGVRDVGFICTALSLGTAEHNSRGRQLQEKLIASNRVRKLQPLGNHSVPFCGPGRRDCWMARSEEIN